MTHDPMCPANIQRAYSTMANIGGVARPVEVTVRSRPCQCDLIAKVRADERTGDFTGWISPTHHAERMRENYDFGFAAALDRARAAVAAVPWGMSYGTGLHVSQAKAIESIDALRGQPTTCARGCRDGLVRVLSASGDDTEVDLCPCQR